LGESAELEEIVVGNDLLQREGVRHQGDRVEGQHAVPDAAEGAFL
jgi:hypothetical protein